MSRDINMRIIDFLEKQKICQKDIFSLPVKLQMQRD